MKYIWVFILPTIAIASALIIVFGFIPYMQDNYVKAWIAVNSTTSCGALIILDQDLTKTYDLTHDDANHFRIQIADKMEREKCP